jgi:hypothetical protein
MPWPAFKFPYGSPPPELPNYLLGPENRIFGSLSDPKFEPVFVGIRILWRVLGS